MTITTNKELITATTKIKLTTTSTRGITSIMEIMKRIITSKYQLDQKDKKKKED